MPRRKGLGLPPKRRVNLEAFKLNNLKAANLDTRELIETAINGHSGHSSSEEEQKRELHNGDLSKSNSPKSTQENGIKNGPPSSENDKYLYTHKKFKKMATIAPFNYVSTPSPSPVTKPPPFQLKMPPSTQTLSTPPCSPNPEFLHRHISKLISENQAIVETMDPFWPKKYVQRSKQDKDKDSPASPNRNSVRFSPHSRTNNPSPAPIPPPSPHHFTFKVNSSPSSPLLLSSASYEAAYIKSLMSSPSPSSPLSSASSSSSTEFSWPKKPASNQHHVDVAYESLRAKHQADSKLATALLRPNSSPLSSSRPVVDEDQSCQPLNLTVKQNSNQVESKVNFRKRAYTSSFPEEAMDCKQPTDYSVKSVMNGPNFAEPGHLTKSKPPRTINVADYPKFTSHKTPTTSPVKVSPPLPSPGPLLGSTPLIDTRSQFHTLRSLEELSRSPMRQNSFQMYGGEVQIRDAIGDAKTVRIEPNKMKLTREITTTKVVTMAKSAGLHSGGTTILQVPQPCESAQVPKINSHTVQGLDKMVIIPVMSKSSTPTVPMVGSPHVITNSISATPLTVTSPYNGGVLTLLHAGKTIPHVPGIPGPLSLQYWEDNASAGSPVNIMSGKTEHRNKLSAEVKPIIKNGRIPSLSEPAATVVETTADVKLTSSQVDDHSQALPSSAIHPLTPHLILTSSTSSDHPEDDKSSRFLRPTSLPLKPGTYTPKRHLSSTAAQSLVSPETPRPRKGYGQLYLNGHAYTYLGLKCSTRLFFCTLNKPQPLYAPLSPEHCKVSMYSNWKICSEVDPNPFGLTPAQMMAHYKSSTRPSQYTVAQGKTDLLMTHSSYWYKKKKKQKEPASPVKQEKVKQGDSVKSEPKSPAGTEETWVSPSIPVGALVSVVFFKTKGNLTKHMKSKAHFKKCVELGVSPMPSSEELSGDEKQVIGDSDKSAIETVHYEYVCSEKLAILTLPFFSSGELEHDVAHSLLSLAQMPPHSETAGLSVSSARPSTYPYSSTCSTTSTVMTTVTTITTMITVPSATAVSALPTVRESEKAAMSILPPTSPNSLNKKRAEFLPPSSGPTPTYVSVLKDGRSMCGICNKIFTKPSQLRLHVNIHYFERPFRCEACAVSFRTKGHLQKHQRSSSHLNKVNMNSTFGTPTTTNPRPFKCDDCKIAFRIHGHLAKHLRSKMHIMKLECGGKLPFGTYAELERCGYNLNDIDTTDCDNSLESLQLLAQKLYEKDPSKLGGWGPEMLPQNGSGTGVHTSASGESSDEGEMDPAPLPSPPLKTEPPLLRELPKSPVDVK
ncbi:transcription factor HIVEP3 [Diaphorina citri]|uniref:Transcription factor HIVEP3 n=1 Tax=Diaphorina citri TaxID=121845 RepID=A0A3Q0JHT6_DIACI|nr:transcription factor HIVEP3 [Diaphorina citri]